MSLVFVPTDHWKGSAFRSKHPLASTRLYICIPSSTKSTIVATSYLQRPPGIEVHRSVSPQVRNLGPYPTTAPSLEEKSNLAVYGHEISRPSSAISTSTQASSQYSQLRHSKSNLQLPALSALASVATSSPSPNGHRYVNFVNMFWRDSFNWSPGTSKYGEECRPIATEDVLTLFQSQELYFHTRNELCHCSSRNKWRWFVEFGKLLPFGWRYFLRCCAFLRDKNPCRHHHNLISYRSPNSISDFRLASTPRPAIFSLRDTSI